MDKTISTGYSRPHVTNSTFLKAVFGDQPKNLCSWTTSFGDYSNPRWGGQLTPIDQCKDYPDRNSYFSIALFDATKSTTGRSIDNFVSMGCLALDDVKEVNLQPSWSLETSKDNYQLGFILKEPISDPALASRLLSEIQAKSLVIKSDKSGNNIVRYVRLPVGSNTKNGGVFSHNLTAWDPNLKYSLDEIIDGLGLDRESVLFAKSKADPFESFGAGFGVDIAEMTRQILASEHYYEPCLKITSHLLGAGVSPQTAQSTVQGIMQAVDPKPADWKRYFDLIPEMVRGASKKFGKTDADVLAAFKPYEYDTSKLTAPRYVIDGFLSAEIFTIAGEAGIGKSSILVPLAAIAAHVCKPDELLKPKLRRKVVYLTEDPEQVERILFALRKHWGIELTNDEIREWFTVIPVHRSEKEVLGQLISAYSQMKAVIQVGKRGPVNVPALFVFDTAAATFSLESENDNSEVSAAISICKKACLANRTPLWIVSHIPKAVTGDQMKNLSARGAGAWTGDVNGTAFIGKNDDGSNTRYMWLGKRRYVAEYDTLAFDAFFSTELVEDELGDLVEIPYMFGTARKSSQTERVNQAQTAKDATLRKKIYFAVLDANQKGIPINRTAVKDMVKGAATTAIQTIGAMLAEGILEEYERTDKCNNNQKMALRVAAVGGSNG